MAVQKMLNFFADQNPAHENRGFRTDTNDENIRQ
jgi:hypothetical protein